MTMPHLMNCQHIPDGWCLRCVGEMYAEIERLRTELEVSQIDQKEDRKILSENIEFKISY